MRLLFAAPDRDLLECYKEILSGDFGETVTAFDGAQVISLISTEHFDAAVIDRELPRVEYKTLVGRIRDAKIPVIVLTDGPVNVRLLTETPLPNAFVRYPFGSEKVADTLRDVLEKTLSEEIIDLSGVKIDIAGSRIVDGPGVTAEELDVIRSVSVNGSADAHEACVGALNAKFARAGAAVRLRYRSMKGYEVVTDNE